MKITNIKLQFFGLFLILFAGITFAQTGKASKNISIVTEKGRSLSLTSAQLAKMPRIEITAKDHDGAEAVFSGIELKTILSSAGAKFGKELRGPEIGQYVIVEAADGYRAVYSLTDLDQDFADKVVILADSKAGTPLDPKNGPWQVVATNEKKHARWVRQVIRLKLMKAK